MTRDLSYFLLLATGLVVGATGCGKKLPAQEKVYPVSGKLIVEGKSNARLQVMLTPTGPSSSFKSHSGFTRPDGSFVIATYGEDDGAPAGTYAVTVATTDNGRDAELEKIVRSYSDPKSPAATVVVKDLPGNTLDPIVLKSKK